MQARHSVQVRDVQAGPDIRGAGGMSLVEVLVATAVLAVCLLAVTRAVSVGNRLLYVSSQHMEAFMRCRERIEQMRATDYCAITSNNFPEETVRLGHLGGVDRTPLYATRSSVIETCTDPEGKRVTVTVSWNFMGRTETESASGVIYRR